MGRFLHLNIVVFILDEMFVVKNISSGIYIYMYCCHLSIGQRCPTQIMETTKIHQMHVFV